MTLPFARFQRKFVCFVCGDEHESFENLKNHIIESHDEGREYITCPLCKCPLRDMKIHFGAVHPSKIIPAGTQMRAMILKDFGSKKKKKKPKFHSGQFVSMKNNGQLMCYRSGWELQVFEFLEELQEVEKYEVEALKIPYFWLGKWHTYYPDIVVHFFDNHREVWEIKPQNQRNIDQNQSKWDACVKFCDSHGLLFKVLSENDIHKLRIKLMNERKSP